MARSQTPYPPATQYSTYPENSPSSTIAYTPQDNTHGYSSYRTSDSAEAPLLAAFAAQASQVQAQDSNNNWQRTSPHLANSGSLAWQQWTSTMTSTLEPQDCYSASALMQRGGRDLYDGQQGPNSQASAALSQMAANGQNVASMDQTVGHIGAHLGNQVPASIGQSWPLNIFDIGQGQTGGS